MLTFLILNLAVFLTFLKIIIILDSYLAVIITMTSGLGN